MTEGYFSRVIQLSYFGCLFSDEMNCTAEMLVSSY